MTEFPETGGMDIAVSVIVPVKDNQTGVDKLIRALEAQTARSFEVIIIDDASRRPIVIPESSLIVRRRRVE